MYRLSDESGHMEFTEISNGTLDKSLLDSNDVFICDTGYEIFVWIGESIKLFCCSCLPRITLHS